MNTSIFNIGYERRNNKWSAVGFVPMVGTVVGHGETKEEALESFHKAAFDCTHSGKHYQEEG